MVRVTGTSKGFEISACATPQIPQNPAHRVGRGVVVGAGGVALLADSRGGCLEFAAPAVELLGGSAAREPQPACREWSRSEADALRQVLAYTHAQKRQRGVDSMLLRLYEPILWRALKVANPHVRRNAATLGLAGAYEVCERRAADLAGDFDFVASNPSSRGVRLPVLPATPRRAPGGGPIE